VQLRMLPQEAQGEAREHSPVIRLVYRISTLAELDRVRSEELLPVALALGRLLLSMTSDPLARPKLPVPQARAKHT
jgi:hypothetical protein